MAESAYCLLAVAAAWFVGLRFIRMEAWKAALQSIVVGLLCAGTSFALVQAGGGLWRIPLLAVIFLASALFTWVRGSRRWGAAIHCFLISLSAWSVFALPLRAFPKAGFPALGVGAALILGFLALTLRLGERFPESDWRNAFPPQEDGRASPGLQQMFFIPAAMCLCLTAAALRFPVRTVESCIWAGLLGSAVFWFGIWLMILIPALQKERSRGLADQQYREEMQSFLNVIRSQRHDYNFHVQTISGLLRQGKTEECLRYVDALEEDTANMNAVLPIKDPAISAMIHNFQVLAGREGIRIHSEIRYDLSQIATNVYETNKIISNLLQNAIDETSRHEDKSYGIWLTILKRGEYCVIRVSNKVEHIPTEEELGQIYQQGFTTKKGHDGVGLSSLRTLIGRYRGALYTQMEGDVIHFVAKVPINYAKIPEE